MYLSDANKSRKYVKQDFREMGLIWLNILQGQWNLGHDSLHTAYSLDIYHKHNNIHITVLNNNSYFSMQQADLQRWVCNGGKMDILHVCWSEFSYRCSVNPPPQLMSPTHGCLIQNTLWYKLILCNVMQWFRFLKHMKTLWHQHHWCLDGKITYWTLRCYYTLYTLAVCHT